MAVACTLDDCTVVNPFEEVCTVTTLVTRATSKPPDLTGVGCAGALLGFSDDRDAGAAFVSLASAAAPAIDPTPDFLSSRRCETEIARLAHGRTTLRGFSHGPVVTRDSGEQ